MGSMAARWAISILLGKAAAAGVSDMVRAVAWYRAAMLPEARTGAFASGYNRGRAVAESLPRGVRGHLVRGAVLPAAPVRLPRGGERAGRAGALRGDGAAAVLHHDARGAARGAVWRRHDRRRTRVPHPGVDAREAAAGRGAHRLPRLLLPPDAGAARGRQPPLAALVPPVQRAPRGAAGRDRGAGGGQAVRPASAAGRSARAYQMRTRFSGLMYSLS